MVIKEVRHDIIVDADNFVSEEQKEDFDTKANEIIKDCTECMEKRLKMLTLLYD